MGCSPHATEGGKEKLKAVVDRKVAGLFKRPERPFSPSLWPMPLA
jgi:hypothetical protein